MSRYPTGRYEPERRSRSPRDRSLDRFSNDRGPPYDPDRGRISTESRHNSISFNSNREPPRGPKALENPPSGPRGGGYAGDFRARGGGRGRGRGGWDDRQDRGFERGDPRDFRGDRRDDGPPPFRDDRDRDRERDWRDRDRDRDRNDFRGPRRESPPRGGRVSPPLDRGFRERDGPPPGIDADRARRGSRDGPLSAGSGGSDNFYGQPSFRGSGPPFRGRGRGRGDWDRGRGRGGGYIDDRDRYARSRSQEGRWQPDRNENRQTDPPARARPVREERDFPDRDPRPRMDRQESVSRPQPAAASRDVSPPPIAPSAPAFGSIPSRQSTFNEPSRPPPTGPRALTDDRPRSAGRDAPRPPANVPSGPARASLSETSPTMPPSIPTGPRAHGQPPRPSSMQWINPALATNKPSKLPDSPKLMQRSTSFAASQQSRPFGQRPDSSGSRHEDDRRPQSGGNDSDRRMSPSGPAIRPLHVMPTKRTSTDLGIVDTIKPEPDLSAQDQQKRNSRVEGARLAVAAPPTPAPEPIVEDDTDSDEEDDLEDYFAVEIEQTEAKVAQLELVAAPDPRDILRRHAAATHEAMSAILRQKDNFASLLSTVPETAQIPRLGANAVNVPFLEWLEGKGTYQDCLEASAKLAEELLLKKEEDVVMAATTVPIPTIEHSDAQDVDMADAIGEIDDQMLAPPELERPATGTSTPAQMEEEDEASEEDEWIDVGEIESDFVEIVRDRIDTPTLDDLPDAGSSLWGEGNPFTVLSNPEDKMQWSIVEEAVMRNVQQEDTEKAAAREAYAAMYKRYLEFTLSDDPVAVRSRASFEKPKEPVEPNPAITAPGNDATTPRPEGRRGGRFATEHDLEQVLQLSRAAFEQEAHNREQTDADKDKLSKKGEAMIPDQVWGEKQRRDKDFFADTGLLTELNTALTWHSLVPVVNFSEEEIKIFIDTYRELPKQWGKIAERLEGRDYRACVIFYYNMKDQLKLKDLLKKGPRRRKKTRGKGRSSALLSELAVGDENENENTDLGEVDGKRRPRRAAAPVWPLDNVNAGDSDSTLPAGTMSRKVLATDGVTPSGEKPEKIKRKRGPKPQESKVPKLAQSIAPLPSSTVAPIKSNRSRSNSKVTPGETLPAYSYVDLPRQPQPAGGSPAMAGRQPPPMWAVDNMMTPKLERTALPSSDLVAPPGLRPDNAPLPSNMSSAFEVSSVSDQLNKVANQPSSYWSVSESTDFPLLLKSFGSDWLGIASHMGTKTHTMCKNFYSKQLKKDHPEWGAIVEEADVKRKRGDAMPVPPMISTGGRTKRYDIVPARSLAAAEAFAAEEELRQEQQLHQGAASKHAFNRYQPVAIAQAPTTQPSPAFTPKQQPLLASQANTLRGDLKPPAGYRETELAFPREAAVRPKKAWEPEEDAQLRMLSEAAQRQDTAEMSREARYRQEQARQQPVKLDSREAASLYETFRQPHEPAAAEASRAPALRDMQRERERHALPPSQAYAPAARQDIQRERFHEFHQPSQASLAREQGVPSSRLAADLRAPAYLQQPAAPPSVPQAPSPSAPTPPAAPRQSEKKASLNFLLNDSEEPAAAPPKRAVEAPTSSNPYATSQAPLQAPSRTSLPPTSQAYARHEPLAYADYRGASSSSAMPSLKPPQHDPRQSHSPQPPPPRHDAASPAEGPGPAEQDYYARHRHAQEYQHNMPPPQARYSAAEEADARFRSYAHDREVPTSRTQVYGDAPSRDVRAARDNREPVPANWPRHVPWLGNLADSREALREAEARDARAASVASRDAAFSQRRDDYAREQPVSNSSRWPASTARPASPPAATAWAAQHGAPYSTSRSSDAQTMHASARSLEQAREPLRPPPTTTSHHQQQAQYPYASQHAAAQQRYHAASPAPRDVAPSQDAYARYSTPAPAQQQQHAARDPREQGIPGRSYTPTSAYDSRALPPQHQQQRHQDQRPSAYSRDSRGDPRLEARHIAQDQRDLRTSHEYQHQQQREQTFHNRPDHSHREASDRSIQDAQAREFLLQQQQQQQQLREAADRDASSAPLPAGYYARGGGDPRDAREVQMMADARERARAAEARERNERMAEARGQDGRYRDEAGRERY